MDDSFQYLHNTLLCLLIMNPFTVNFDSNRTNLRSMNIQVFSSTITRTVYSGSNLQIFTAPSIVLAPSLFFKQYEMSP